MSIFTAYSNVEELQMIYNYCEAHADVILADSSPVEDLINPGLIGSNYSGKTCKDIRAQKVQEEINTRLGEWLRGKANMK